jgi:uncharacterized protein YcfJ
VTDVGGEPGAMAAYTREVVPANDAVGWSLQEARAARQTVLAAPSDLPLAPDDPTALLDPVLDTLAVLDRVPAAVARALEELDGWEATGRTGPPPPFRHTRDDDRFDVAVSSHVRRDLRASAERRRHGPIAGGDVLGVGLAGLEEVAGHATDDVADVVRRVDRAGLGAPRSASTLVRQGAGPIGLALAAHDDLRATASDPLATVGDRTASVTAAVSVEGGLSVAGGTLGAAGGAKLGAALGVPGGPVGIAVGAAAGAAAGATLGSRVRRTSPVQATEQRFGQLVDHTARTGREPDRYDALRGRMAVREEATR